MNKKILTGKKMSEDDYHHCISEDQPEKIAATDAGKIYVLRGEYLTMFYISISDDEFYRFVVPAIDGKILCYLSKSLPVEQFFAIILNLSE